MPKLHAQAGGTFAIAPTPFHDDGRLDEKSIDRLTDFYAEVGCNGVTVLGILGEAPKLDAAEAEQVAVRFVKRAKKMQVIVGVSAPGFATMRSLARASMDAGAAGVMIAPPPSLRTDDQIVGYYKQAAEAIGPDVPWVLQDYPLTLQVVFTPAVVRKIVMDNPNCVMLKHEDWPGLEKISTLRGFQKGGSLRPLSILCGNGGTFLDFEMERGADGAMTGYAFPQLLIDVVCLSKAGLRDGASVDGKSRDEIEVFMMVRHHQIEFNSGALVFPGGSVDAGDKEIVARADLYSGGEGLSEADRGFRIAAIRETFEESGILL